MCHDLGLVDQQPDLTTLISLIEVDSSITRRVAHMHDQRYRLWFAPDFLNVYHDFLDNLSNYIPATTFTRLDVATASARQAVLAAFPPHLARLLLPAATGLSQGSETR